ncbi:epoxide hydrolase [Trichoderma arundinaceum]|uniref:Epoxide hydrolase n=1 Tax=Trichoderma arundinaceum TaxID=490622 RepID=A0A395NN93_TRIAR|nr:epoxide hydrolase [Trichoderma arundinaceum]
MSAQNVNLPFDDWPSIRVKTADTSLFARYGGTGPAVLLLHGCPQHSLMWHKVGPLLSSKYTVIAPDLPGMGQSTLSESGNYSSAAAAEAIVALLDFLKIEKVAVFGYDKGASVGSVLAWKYTDRVTSLSVGEYALPAYGHEVIQNPDPSRNLYGHWHLALFTVPEAAEFLIRGREKEFLNWYFWHSSYSAGATISLDHIERYAAALSKPGYLRSMTEFLNGNIWREVEYFKPLRDDPIRFPLTVLWGEATMVPEDISQGLWGPTATSVKTVYVPKAGHWLADENPKWLATFIDKNVSSSSVGPSVVDLSYLEDQITMI